LGLNKYRAGSEKGYFIFLCLFIVGCFPSLREGADGRYDYSLIHLGSKDEALKKMIKSIYRIETSTTFKEEKRIFTLKISGVDSSW
jgi:hypothetical protein